MTHPRLVGALEETPPVIGHHTLTSQDLTPPPPPLAPDQSGWRCLASTRTDLPGNPLAAGIQLTRNSLKIKRKGEARDRASTGGRLGTGAQRKLEGTLEATSPQRA